MSKKQFVTNINNVATDENGNINLGISDIPSLSDELTNPKLTNLVGSLKIFVSLVFEKSNLEFLFIENLIIFINKCF